MPIHGAREHAELRRAEGVLRYSSPPTPGRQPWIRSPRFSAQTWPSGYLRGLGAMTTPVLLTVGEKEYGMMKGSARELATGSPRRGVCREGRGTQLAPRSSRPVHADPARVDGGRAPARRSQSRCSAGEPTGMKNQVSSKTWFLFGSEGDRLSLGKEGAMPEITTGIDEYGAAADYYDYVPAYAERSDVAFFVDMARDSGGPVLELGCGTGRVLLPTARAGIAITGLDLSPGMLRILRGRLAAEPPDVQARVRLVEGDMRSFDLGQTVRPGHPPLPAVPAPDHRRGGAGVPRRHPAPSLARAGGWCSTSSTRR